MYICPIKTINMYIIAGASGNTGGRVAKKLLAAGQLVTVIGRDADRLAALTELGAVPAIGELQDVAFMTNILKGAKAAYLLIPPHFGAEDFRAYQMATADALTEAVAASEISKVVILSSVGAHLSEDSGVILALNYWENKLKSVPGLSVLALRAGFFMQNFLGNIGLIRSMNINGGFPIEGNIPFGMIHVNDIGDYAAQRLLALDFEGYQFQNLIGQRALSLQEATSALGTAIGKPELPWVSFSYEQAFEGMKSAGFTPSLAGLYVEFCKALNEGRLQSDFTPDDSSTTSTSIEDFSKEFAAVWNS